MTTRLALLAALVLAACNPQLRGNSADLSQYGPPRAALKGFGVEIRGTSIAFAVNLACEQTVTRFEAARAVREVVPCDRWKSEEMGPFSLETPWGDTELAILESSRDLVFEPRWDATGLDPLAADSADKLVGPWRLVSPSKEGELWWKPTEQQRLDMVALIGDETDTQILVRKSEPPPRLAVVKFIVDDNRLRTGIPAKLSLTVRNDGDGGAFRVVATTRSSEPTLHGQQFSFGWIKPGETKTRSISVTLPLTVAEESAMVVVGFAEANDRAPPTHAQRFRIVRGADAPELHLTCKLADAKMVSVGQWVDAGQRSFVICKIQNGGRIDASGVVVSIAIDGNPTARGEPVTIGPGKTREVRVPFAIPTSMEPEQVLAVRVTVNEPTTGRQFVVDFAPVVRMPALCPDGRLTRAVYQEKRAKLHSALRSGTLTQEEFDRYDAELVGCLE